MARDKANRYSGMDNFSAYGILYPEKNSASEGPFDILNTPLGISVIRIMSTLA